MNNSFAGSVHARGRAQRENFIPRAIREFCRGLAEFCGAAMLVGALVAAAPLTAFAQNTAIPSRITAQINESTLTTLRGNTHPLARPQYDQGAVAESQPIHRMLLLLQRSPAQEAALRTLIDQQQVKSSSSYHQWLTPQQFGQQYGPAPADIQAVASWLQSHGFQIARVANGGTLIEFSGTAGQVLSAFHTQIHRYVVNGQEHFANSTDPQIPTALVPVVAGLDSLNNFRRKPLSHALGVFSKTKATGEVKPLKRFAAAQAGNWPSPAFTFGFPGCSLTSNNCFALGPADFDAIYNVPSGGGTGQTIAIVGDSDICTGPFIGTTYLGPFGANVTCTSDDVANFRSLFGLPTNSPNVVLDGPDPGFNSDETEGDLDVEWSGAVAPNATIDFVIAESTEASNGIDLAAEHIIDNNLAPVMSESFGSCESSLGQGGNEFYSTIWEQAAAQGITVIISAGDSGSAGCDDENTEQTAENGLAVNGIASTPFNVATGGTDFDYTLPTTSTYGSTYWNAGNATGTQESAKGYIPETVWNDSCAQSFVNDCGSTNSNSNSLNIVAGGGGQSNCINPLYNDDDIFTGCLPAFTNSALTGYPKPSWQPVAVASGLGITTDLTRDLPDVSLFASDGLMSASFYIVCEQDLDVNDAPCSLNTTQPFYTFVPVGGTSSSAPTFAGIMALVNQKMASLSLSAQQGDANYVLYPLFNNQVTAELSCNSSTGPNTASPAGCTFYDVTKGSNSVPCIAGFLNCSTTLGTGDLVFGATPAWNAGTGYDLATGLGSLNVTNLVANWATAAGSFTPTKTTLCLVSGNTGSPTCSNPPAAVSITHGAFVSGTITVSNNSNQVLPLTSTLTQPEDAALIGVFSGGATIPVDRLDADTGNADIYPLTSGQITGAFTQELVGGGYAVHAHYAGDGKYGSSDSNAINVTVAAENSIARACVMVVNTVTEEITGQVLTAPYSCSSATTAQYGDLNLVRVDVIGASSGLETATGSVALTDNGSAIVGPNGTTVSSFTLNSEGYLEDQTEFLAVGPHTFVAQYSGMSGSGDGSYNASPNSSVVSFNVAKCNTATAITTPPTTIPSGQHITITAFLDSATSGNPSVGSSGANMGGTVTFTTPTQSVTFPLAPTPHTPNWLAAGVCASLALFLLLLLRFPVRQRWVVALSTLVLAVALGTSVSCGGSSSSSGGGGGGGSTTLGSMAPTATTDANGFVAGQASITITPTATETITVTYSGDANYMGSTSTAVTITVQ